MKLIWCYKTLKGVAFQHNAVSSKREVVARNRPIPASKCDDVEPNMRSRTLKRVPFWLEQNAKSSTRENVKQNKLLPTLQSNMKWQNSTTVVFQVFLILVMADQHFLVRAAILIGLN